MNGRREREREAGLACPLLASWGGLGDVILLLLHALYYTLLGRARAFSKERKKGGRERERRRDTQPQKASGGLLAAMGM